MLKATEVVKEKKQATKNIADMIFLKQIKWSH